MEGRRATVHNQRKGKNGVFKAKHNDCTYLDEDKRPKENIYWSGATGFTNKPNFEKYERGFYDKHFTAALEKQNAKHVKARNHKRVKTMDDWYTSSKTCPDETLNYVGSKDDKPLSRELIQKIIFEQLAWEQRTFPNVRILDIGVHFHEEGAVHSHTRKVFIGHDEDGIEVLNQSKALEEMGIERPEPDKPAGRKNNAKITYTNMVRAHLVEVCKKYGVEVITEPRSPEEAGMTREELIEHRASERANKMIEDAEAVVQQKAIEAENFRSKRDELEKEVTGLEQRKTALQDELDTKLDEYDRLVDKIDELVKQSRELDKEIRSKQKVMTEQQKQKYEAAQKKFMNKAREMSDNDIEIEF